MASVDDRLADLMIEFPEMISLERFPISIKEVDVVPMQVHEYKLGEGRSLAERGYTSMEAVRGLLPVGDTHVSFQVEDHFGLNAANYHSLVEAIKKKRQEILES